MNNSERINQILSKISQGIVEESELKFLNQARVSNERLSVQVGKSVVNIGNGEGIQIGDRIYYECNENFIKALRQEQSNDHKGIIWKNLVDIKHFLQHGFFEQLKNSQSISGEDLIIIHQVYRVFQEERPYISEEVYNYFNQQVIPDLENGINAIFDTLREPIEFRQKYGYVENEAKYVSQFNLLLNQTHEIYTNHLEYLRKELFKNDY